MIHEKHFEYYLDNKTYEGVFCWDDDFQGKRPGVLVSHAWFGQGSFEIEKAKALAQLGYVSFALDMYGKNRRAQNADEASILMHECVDDRVELRARILNAIETLKAHELCDANRIGAIGFCFGGRCVLDLARTGENIGGVVSFHGIYDPPPFIDDKPIEASVLVLHGWEDPLATPQQTVALGKELTQREADWQILAFGHTGHAFTNPNANDSANGMMFNTKSNDRAWISMTRFFEEVFN